MQVVFSDYAIEKDHVFIIAVAHQHRQPDYWVDRD